MIQIFNRKTYFLKTNIGFDSLEIESCQKYDLLADYNIGLTEYSGEELQYDMI